MGNVASRPADVLRLAVVVGALGVVFGDIGTSPIYTLQTVFNPANPRPVPVTPENVLGVVSLVFWSVMLIVTVTYVLLAMRVDHDGEGGIMALITLLRRWAARGRTRTAMALAGLGLFGAALFLGDSMITPAISVLSAVQGIEVANPSFGPWVVPLTVVIIAGLFAAQRCGTAAVGRLFGPVMITWFTAIAACGAWGVANEPGILAALSPTYALGFLAGRFELAFFTLGTIVLAVTGAEALYADMGHFGRRSISVGWIFLVLPACMLSYLGQGALILQDRANLSAPFFLLAPDWALVPMVVLATGATVIASQAVITGAFSVTAQAAQLGYLPQLRIVHTSRAARGQIYVPRVNWLLMVAVLVLVLAFRSPTSLAYAYGMAVTGTITITTILFFYVAWHTWHVPRWALAVLATVLLTIDLLFVAANLTKLTHGAWIPLVIAVIAYTVMTTWQRGRKVVAARRAALEGSLRTFVEGLAPPDASDAVADGTAIFLNRASDTAPLALRTHLERHHMRYERVAVVAIEIDVMPRRADEDRVSVAHLGRPDAGVTHVTVRFGYAERPDIPTALARYLPEQTHTRLDLEHATYFLSRVEIRLGDERDMPAWRRWLFVATSYLAADATEHFGLPQERTVLLGARIEV